MAAPRPNNESSAEDWQRHYLHQLHRRIKDAAIAIDDTCDAMLDAPQANAALDLHNPQHLILTTRYQDLNGGRTASKSTPNVPYYSNIGFQHIDRAKSISHGVQNQIDEASKAYLVSETMHDFAPARIRALRDAAHKTSLGLYQAIGLLAPMASTYKKETYLPEYAEQLLNANYDISHAVHMMALIERLQDHPEETRTVPPAMPKTNERIHSMLSETIETLHHTGNALLTTAERHPDHVTFSIDGQDYFNTLHALEFERPNTEHLIESTVRCFSSPQNQVEKSHMLFLLNEAKQWCRTYAMTAQHCLSEMQKSETILESLDTKGENALNECSERLVRVNRAIKTLDSLIPDSPDELRRR